MVFFSHKIVSFQNKKCFDFAFFKNHFLKRVVTKVIRKKVINRWPKTIHDRRSYTHQLIETAKHSLSTDWKCRKRNQSTTEKLVILMFIFWREAFFSTPEGIMVSAVHKSLFYKLLHFFFQKH